MRGIEWLPAFNDHNREATIKTWIYDGDTNIPLSCNDINFGSGIVEDSVHWSVLWQLQNSAAAANINTTLSTLGGMRQNDEWQFLFQNFILYGIFFDRNRGVLYRFLNLYSKQKVACICMYASSCLYFILRRAITYMLRFN